MQALLAALLILGPWVAPVTTAAESAATLVTRGSSRGIPACASCHGATGSGNAELGYPRLAGLPAPYIEAQLEALAAGRRQNALMNAVAVKLSAKQRRELAQYFAALPFEPVSPVPARAQSGAGAELALHGRWSQNVPACTRCHGEAGVGVGERFPPLAGQPSRYIESQLLAWQQGTRHGEPLGLMQGIASHLSASDVHAVAAYFGVPPSASGDAPGGDAPPRAGGAAAGDGEPPPGERALPDGEFGKAVLLGRRIFEDPATYAKDYVGNALACSNCHLDAGRRADSAPLWAAFVAYPAYRAKTHRVESLEERMQGCFKYSMNGKSPPLGDPVLVSLSTYASWLARGERVDPNLPGRGYPRLPKPALAADFQRGARVYGEKCALCHGAGGEGQADHGGHAAFPALWGARSFNWGAGMGSITLAAGFIKANMPYSEGGSLSDQEAWDVATFVDSHERPQDPRFTGSVAETRAKYHDGPDWMYGVEVGGHVLGSDSVPPGPTPTGPGPTH